MFLHFPFCKAMTDTTQHQESSREKEKERIFIGPNVVLEHAILLTSLPGLGLLPDVRKYFEEFYDAKKLENILKRIPIPPSCTTLRCNLMEKTREEISEELKTHLPSSFSIHLDPILPDVLIVSSDSSSSSSSTSIFSSCSSSSTPELCPRTSSSSPWYLSFPHVTVDSSCGEAVLRGADIFSIGVMGTSSSIHKGSTVVVFVDLENKVLRGKSSVPPQTPLLVLGLGVSQLGRKKLLKQEKGVIGIKMVTITYPSSSSPPPLISHTTTLHSSPLTLIPSSSFSSFPPLNGVMPSLLFLQNYASILVGHLLDPQPGESVIDLCSSPGGKTTHLGLLMKNKGRIVALDKSYLKAQEVQKLATRFNLTCIETYPQDATKVLLEFPSSSFSSSSSSTSPSSSLAVSASPFTPSSSTLPSVSEAPSSSASASAPSAPSSTTPGDAKKTTKTIGRKKVTPTPKASSTSSSSTSFHCAPETFDRVLLDPPCSGLGQRPRLSSSSLSSFTLPSLLQHSSYQRRILKTAVHLLKPGGILVYSTCTLNPAENELNVHHALETYPCLSLEASSIDRPELRYLGHPGLPNCKLTEEERKMVQRFEPSPPPSSAATSSSSSSSSSSSTSSASGEIVIGHCCSKPDSLDSIGFFVARFRKSGSCYTSPSPSLFPSPL